ncbi:hypothetical protein SAMN06295888_11542 [Desulfonatronum zhilinae]|nr:hypothetical protein SAMN06295888_11542 [Desulfonatronum zhilinae]
MSIRYLAQGLVNDLVLPDQCGLNKLMSRARDGQEKQPLSFPNGKRWHYWFLFHLEDFGSDDKSELDLLLWYGDILYCVEVKAFTNPNATNVKREIVRNYVKLKDLVGKGLYFDPMLDIVPVLLYSNPVHLKNNPSAEKYKYFVEGYLTRKGVNHRYAMNYWQNIHEQTAPEIDRKMLYLTWDDVYFAALEAGLNGMAAELATRKDEVQFVPLVTPGIEEQSRSRMPTI